MELTGPLKETKMLAYIPGPGRYDSKSMLDQRSSSLKPRLPDNTNKHLIKVFSALVRILDPEPTSQRRWAKTCIMQLPTTRTIPIIR
jgi:hypothetical protein